jgi:hypothetical protein
MTFARYRGLTVSRQVPCPCSRCQAAAQPQLYDYDQLADDLEHGWPNIQCHVSRQDELGPGGQDLRKRVDRLSEVMAHYP